MQPVIPLLPYIREGEGHGSAAIFDVDRTPFAVIGAKLERERERKRQDQKTFQDKLIELEGMSANALPQHQKELLDDYNTNVIDYYQQGKKEGKTFSPGTPEYFEALRRANKSKSNGIKAALAKAEYLETLKLHSQNPGKYDDESVKNRLEYFNTPLNDINFQVAPRMEASFDPLVYDKKISQLEKMKEEVDLEHPVKVDNANGNVIVPVHYYQDPVSAANMVMNDNSPGGKKRKLAALENFHGMAVNDPTEYENVVKELSKKNRDVLTNPEVLEREGTRYMLANNYSGSFTNKKDFKSIPDVDYRNQLALKTAEAKKQNIQIVSSAEELPAVSNQVNTATGGNKSTIPLAKKVGMIKFSDKPATENKALDFIVPYYYDSKGVRHETNGEVLTAHASSAMQHYNEDTHKREWVTVGKKPVRDKYGVTQYETVYMPYDQTEETIVSNYGQYGVTPQKLRAGMSDAAKKAAGSSTSTSAVPTNQPATKPTAKTVPLSTIKSKIGTKGYEGYTEQELIDYYTGQGYEISGLNKDPLGIRR